MKKIIEKLKNSKHLPLLLFVLTCLASDILLRALTTGSTFYWKPILAGTAILILISIIPMLMDFKKRNRIFKVLSILVAILSAVNYLYYEHFDSFISFSIIHQVGLLFQMDGSISSTLDFKALLFFIPPIGFIFSMKKLERMDYFNKIEERKSFRKILRPVVVGFVCLVAVLTTLTSTDYSRLVKQWNRPYLVQSLGMFSYTVADAVKSVTGPSTAIAQLDEEVVADYVDKLVIDNTSIKTENNEESKNYKDIFKGRDVYIIHYESPQTFAMDLEFADGNVTPFLNKMTDEGLSFNNFYPQHSVGTSSDTEFTFNTSLYPINNGTVFMSHSDREFVTLQNLLTDEGYFSVSMHGNTGDFWNRNVMHETLGYNYYFSKNDYVIDEEIGLGLSDVSFFRQSVEKIKALKEDKEKVAATLITLTNHYPFDDVEKYGEFDVGHLEGSIIGNYLKSFHYADQALESFITQMDEEGLLDNAIVVLYGDHHAQLSMSDYELLYNYNPETDEYYTEEDPEYTFLDTVTRKKINRTPFIIWTKDQAINEKVDTPMGMIDALPTLGNMLGIFNEYQIGNDIMNLDSNTVGFPDGSWINEDYFYSASSTVYYDHEGNEVEEDTSLLKITEEIEEELLLSNGIINGDLIKSHDMDEINDMDEHSIE